MLIEEVLIWLAPLLLLLTSLLLSWTGCARKKTAPKARLEPNPDQPLVEPTPIAPPPPPTPQERQQQERKQLSYKPPPREKAKAKTQRTARKEPTDEKTMATQKTDVSTHVLPIQNEDHTLEVSVSTHERFCSRGVNGKGAWKGVAPGKSLDADVEVILEPGEEAPGIAETAFLMKELEDGDERMEKLEAKTNARLALYLRWLGENDTTLSS